MLDKFPKIPYDYDKIRLDRIFQNPKVKNFPNIGIQTKNSMKVFGELRLPELPKDKPYLMACFVSSIDGKIAFEDNPAGPVIAQSNQMDPDGAAADFWILNLMRASADAIFSGVVSMQKEPNGTCGIFDQELEDERVKNGKHRAPWVIACSRDGSHIPFDDTLLESQPVMFNTSPVGLKAIEKGIKQDYYVVGPYKSLDEIDEDKVINEFNINKYKKTPVIVTGEDNRPNLKILMKLLKLMGINTAIAESPSFVHSLIEEQLLDEMTVNYSCIYVGGAAKGFGTGMKSFTSVDHPHTEMLSIHSHSASFFYFRHKLIYGLKPEGYLGSIY